MASNGSSTLPGISLARSAVSAGGGRDAEQLGEGEAAALLHLHPAAPPGTSLEAIRHGSPTLFGRSNDPSFPLRKWNERWVILDPTTGKIEYKVRRSDKDVRGAIVFDSTSTVTLSPMNFQNSQRCKSMGIYFTCDSIGTAGS
nr:unnamed protein product [Digitaria exilis]